MNANFGDVPLGMDMLKQFWAQAAAGATTPNADATSSAASAPSVTPALHTALSQYLTPTMDVAELDRRMGDLKTVLHWMEMNTQLLRSNLHALELQRNTIATIQSMMGGVASATKNDTNDTNKAGVQKEGAHANPTAPWMTAWQQVMQQSAQAMSATPAETKPVAAAKKPAAKKTLASKASTAKSSKTK